MALLSFRRQRLSRVEDFIPAVPDFVPQLALIPADRGRAVSLPNQPTRVPAADRPPEHGYSSGDGPGLNRPYGEPSAPLSRSELFSTFGATGTQFFAGLISDTLYQESEPAEWRGDRRWKTINTMWRRDGQFAATLNVCLLPLLGATYSINPGDDSDLAVTQAQFVADNLLHGMRQTWHHLLRTFYMNRMRYGHFLGEKCWQIGDDGMVRLSKVPVRLPETIYRWFPNDDDELDRIMQRVWIQNKDGVTGTFKFPIIPADKLLLSTRNQEGNDFRGISLFRQAWFHGDMKFKLYIIDGIAAERNGLGIPWAQPSNEPGITLQDSDWKQAAAVLASYHAGEKQYVLMPRGWQWGVKAVEGEVRNIMPSIEHHDLLIPRSVLAQFINVDSGGTLIAARDSSSFFLQAEEAESDEGCESINAVIREIVDLNTVEHGGPWPKPERYPTIAVTGIENRDLDALLRGVAALMTAGALTYDEPMENAIRGYLDFPVKADAQGAGTGGVDTDSQGDTTADDTAEGISGIGATGDTTALSRSGLSIGTRVTFHSGQQLTPLSIHLSGKELIKKKFTIRMSGAYREEKRDLGLEAIFKAVKTILSREEYSDIDPIGNEWLCLRRRVPDPNSDGDFDSSEPIALGYTHVRWLLGDGGKSGKNCPQCQKMSKRGLMKLSELHIEPGDGSTYCGEWCSCELEYRRAINVKVGLPAQGTTKR